MGQAGLQDRITFLKGRFAQYYRSATFEMPPRFGRREWGFIYHGEDSFHRHLGFSREADLRDHLSGTSRGSVPAHAYHSAAYYSRPDRPTMQEKEWLGADLIFDLDADHLKGAEGMSYQDMLAAVKRQTVNLLDNFILSDFGFAPEQVRVAFSGGRGYHVHIDDQSVLGLLAPQRRELVDYITGRGLELGALVKYKGYAGRYYGDRWVAKKPVLQLYPKGSGGWRGKLTRAMIAHTEELAGRDRDEVVKGFVEQSKTKKMSERQAGQLYDTLFGGRQGERVCDRLVAHGNLEVFPTDALRDAYLNYILDTQRVSLAGETDEPVTGDVKRLIRMAGSLHGKTGFRVVPMTRDELDGFDPMRDAVAFGGSPTRVTLDKPIDVTLKGERVKAEPGERELPEFAAVFACCQKLASAAAPKRDRQ